MELTTENNFFMFIKLIFVPTIIILFIRPKWLFYFLIFSLLEPTRAFSLEDYVILGNINIKFYEIILTLIYLSSIWSKNRRIKDCINSSFIVFIAFALLSLLRGLIAGFNQSAFNHFRTFYSMGMYIAIPLMFKDRDELFKVLRFFFIATIAMGIIELLAVSHIIPLHLSERRFTTFMSATQGAILAMPFIFFFSTIKFIRKAPLTTYTGSAFCFFASFWSASRGVWLGLIASITVIISFLDLKRKILVTIIIFLLALFAFVFSKSMVIERYDMNILDRFKTLVDSKQSTASWRLNAWWQMIQDIKNKPILGCPFGTPSTFFDFTTGHIQNHAPHNEFLKITRYTGLLGFGAFMFFIINIFISGFQFIKRNKGSKYSYEVLGFLMCFLFHCVTAMFTQAFTTMDRSPLVWAVPGIITLYILLEKEDLKSKIKN